MDDSDLAALRARLAALEKEVKSLRQALAGLRQTPPVDLTPTPGLVSGEQEPFSLSVPTAQPELQPDLPVASQPPKPSAAPAVRTKKSRPKRPEGPPTKDQFEAARSILMDGYTPDRPGDGDRLLKTIVYRLLLGSSKGFKSAELDSARTVARYLIEQAGLRSGPGFRDGKLRSLLKKYVPFDPITSIRRLPR